MEDKSLALVADEDLMYGIDKGFYPEFKKEDVKVVPVGGSLIIKNGEAPRVGMVYIFDRYSQCYVPSLKGDMKSFDESIIDTFAEAKAVAYRGALLKMGAKRIFMEETKEKGREEENRAGGSVRVLMVNVTGEGSWGDKAMNTFRRKMEITMPNNKAESVGEVEKYINDHGLNGVGDLSNFLDALRRGVLTGSSQCLEVEVFGEVDNALSIAAGVNFKAVGISAKYNNETRTWEKGKKTFIVEF